MSTTFCILGGGGAFAIHTAFHLLEKYPDCRVIGIGRNFLRSEPFSLNIEKHPRYAYYSYHLTYELDLLLEILDLEQPEVIINYAAQGEGAVSWKNSWRFFETNSMGLARLVEELMKRDWLKRFIQIGSSEVYGSVVHSVDEEAPIRPSSPYAASKVAFDFYLQSVASHKGFPMNILRPSNAYCPGQLLHRIIPKAIWCGVTGNKLPLHGGGKARKSYIHATDLARAISLVIDKAPLGTVYNVGPDIPTYIRDVVHKCAIAMGKKLEDICVVSEDRLGQDSCYWLNSDEIEALGWKPLISWEAGLVEMVKWGETYHQELQAMSPDYVFRG